MKKQLLYALPAFLLLAHGHSALAQACPNGDFENWNLKAYSQPDSMWYTSNPQSIIQKDTLTVWPVAGFSGQAVHIESAIVGGDSLQAFIANTAGDPTHGQGGVPYSQQPTAITGYYRYNMVSGDSALILVVFKKAGIPISQNIFKMGGSVSSFTAFSFTLGTLAVAPDSVIIAAASSNLTNNVIESGSWLELDQVEFAGSGITQNIPGGSFDNWLSDTVFAPVSWTGSQSGQGGNGVNRSTAHYSGNYSVELISQPGGGGGPVSPAQITTGKFTNMGPTGGLPYTLMADTLSGYYMYTPVGTDTGHLNISLSAAGAMAGGDFYNFTTASTWTYFSIPFSAVSTPDSMRIDVQSSSFSAATPGSILYLDHVQLSSAPLPNLGVNAIAVSNKVIAYPNPTNDVFNIKLENTAGRVNVKLYDMVGRIMDGRNYNTAPSVIQLPVSNLPAGLYFYEVTNNGNTTRGKFEKQ